MQNPIRFSRVLFFITLLISLLAFVSAPAMLCDSASAAPLKQAPDVDLSLTMSVNDATPNKDQDIVFTITVSNSAGSAVATNVTVNAALPAGLAWQTDDGGGAYNNGTGVWTVGVLANNSSAVLHVTAKNTTTSTKTYTADAVANLQTDVNSGNDNASVGITTITDLNLTITPISSAVSPGDNVVFTIKVTNGGPNVATGVTVMDDLSLTGLTYVTDDGGGTYNDGTGIWIIGSLGSNGDSASLKITAQTPITGGVYTNSAEVWTSAEPDNDSTPGNGSTPPTQEDDYDTSVITAEKADLSLIATVDSTTPLTKYVQFTVAVTNNGPSDATDVTVKDMLPAGVVYISDNLGTYNSSSGIWAVGFLANGSTATLIINARIASPGAKVNIAEVWTSDQFDDNSTPGNGVASENDYDAAPATTPLVADLSLTKTVDIITPAVSGDPVEFTITVTNNGPDTATNVTVQDVLPPDLTYVTDDGGGVHNSGTVTWTVGSLTPSGAGSSAILHIIATSSSTNPIGTNYAEVWTSDQVDPDSTPGFDGTVNNEDDDDGTPYADLSLSNVVNNPTPKLGENIIFTVTVANAGPLNATGVVVKDLLDTNFFTFVSSVQTGGGGPGATPYNTATGLWGVGDLASNATAKLTITATVKQTGTLTNFAEVWDSDQFDKDSTPGIGTPTIIGEDDDEAATVTPSAGMAVVISEVAWSGTTVGKIGRAHV